MDKRQFLALAPAALPALATPPVLAASAKRGGTPLLTVSGAIGRGNRGAFDPALDQLMKKHGVAFARAHRFDLASLLALPTNSIRPTLEYDNRPHTLSGPLLADVLRAAGASLSGDGRLVLRAIDGYAAVVKFSDVREYRFIVATHLDGQAMPLGGLGPLWAVFDADRYADWNTKPVNQRFGLCPWGVYHIEVQAS